MFDEEDPEILRDTNDRKYTGGDLAPSPHFSYQFRRLIDLALPENVRSSGLDLGGGAGQYSLTLQILGYNVTLIDISELAFHRASELGVARAKGMELATARLPNDLEHFRADYDVPCRTVAGHGHTLNRTCRTLNNEVLWPGGLDRSAAGLRAEAYDPSYLKELDDYVSDTVPETNGGFRSGRALDTMAAGSPRILFLTRPNLWAFTPFVRLRRTAKVLLKGMTWANDSFSHQNWLRGSSWADCDFSRDNFWPRINPGKYPAGNSEYESP